MRYDEIRGDTMRYDEIRGDTRRYEEEPLLRPERDRLLAIKAQSSAIKGDRTCAQSVTAFSRRMREARRLSPAAAERRSTHLWGEEGWAPR